MNHWYMTERVAQERHADFQREVEVPTLLTSLEDLPDPHPGPIDRLLSTIARARAGLLAGIDRRLGGDHDLSGVGRHG
jgi:PIN domain nuclease of toxin-antitoxin system